MTVTAAAGFVASGVRANIRKEKRDLAIVRSLPQATGAAVWTQNRVLAAPVVVSKRHLERAQPQAVVVNSGIANAATGAQGEADALATAERAAAVLGLVPEQVLVLSTGVIGAPMPMDRVLAGVDAAAAALSTDGGAGAAEAILTTDTHPKTSVAHGDGFIVGGMAKGSGMIHPNLATMLAVVTTDYPLGPGEAIDLLRPAVDVSFNSITVDGECSTNDAVVLLASGAAAVERTPASDVRRRPPTNSTGMPRRFISSVICGPAPCTTMTSCPSSRRPRMRSADSGATAPPTFTTSLMSGIPR